PSGWPNCSARPSPRPRLNASPPNHREGPGGGASKRSAAVRRPSGCAETPATDAPTSRLPLGQRLTEVRHAVRAPPEPLETAVPVGVVQRVALDLGVGAGVEDQHVVPVLVDGERVVARPADPDGLAG